MQVRIERVEAGNERGERLHSLPEVVVMRDDEAWLAEQEVEGKVGDRLSRLASHKERESGKRRDGRLQQLPGSDAALHTLVEQFRVDRPQEFAAPQRLHGRQRKLALGEDHDFVVVDPGSRSQGAHAGEAQRDQG